MISRTSLLPNHDGILLFYCSGGSQGLDMNIVNVYDIQNKFIAYSAPVPDVVDVMCEWGSLYVLGGDRKVRKGTACSD